MREPIANTAETGQFFESALALSAVSLCICLTISDGYLPSDGRLWWSIALLTLALLSCIAALLFPRAPMPDFAAVPLLRIFGKAPTLPLLATAWGIQLPLLHALYHPLAPLFWLAAAAAVVAFVALPIVHRPWAMRDVLSIVILLLGFGLCGFAVLRFMHVDEGDFMVFQREASLALAAGKNPYAMTFPNIYGDHSPFYGAELSVNGVLQFGFPYFPLMLLWVAPAQLLMSDFRYAHLLAMLLAAVFVMALSPSRVVAATAFFMVFCAPAFYVLQSGWTEPLPAMLLCANVWLASRGARFQGAALGVLVAAKQYLIFALPLLFLLPPSGASTNKAHWKSLAAAVAVAALITLPFMLWNVRAFWWSVVELQFHQPFRDDALSYLALLKSLGGPQLSSMISFLATAGAIFFCLRRAPHTPAGFAASVALVHFVFFIFNKQAFVNYYYFVFAMLCCATAAAHVENTSAAA